MTNCSEIMITREALKRAHYSLELWSRKWKDKAGIPRTGSKDPAPSTNDAKLIRIWGKDGVDHILTLVCQMESEFREAHSIMRSLDVETSFKPKTRDTLSASDFSVPRHRHRLSPSRFSDSFKNLHWSFARRHARQVTPRNIIIKDEEHKPKILKKIMWSVYIKERLRQHTTLIGSWLQDLRRLAKESFEEQARLQGQHMNSPPAASAYPQHHDPIFGEIDRGPNIDRTVERAAETLYLSLTKFPNLLPDNVQLALMNTRDSCTKVRRLVADDKLFAISPGESYKFPLLLPGDPLSRSQIVVAECLPTRLSRETYRQIKLDEAYSLPEIATLDIIFQLLRVGPREDYQDYVRGQRMLITSEEGLLILHPCHRFAQGMHNISQVSLSQVLSRLPKRDLSSYRNRLAMASTICSNVIELYESGLLPFDLSSDTIHAFEPSFSRAHFSHDEAETLFVPVTDTNKDRAAVQLPSPFDAIHRQYEQALISNEARVSLLFHRLGIVLFELGRGRSAKHFFAAAFFAPQTYTQDGKTATAVFGEIDKICFGRSYRDVVKLCLTGSLYVNVVTDVSGGFNRLVVEKLKHLEGVMERIVEGGDF